MVIPLSAPPLPGQPRGARDRVVAPVQRLVLASVDRLVLRSARRDGDRVVAGPERVGPVHPRRGDGAAAADIARDVRTQARGPPGILAGPQVAHDDMDSLHRAE